MCRPQRWRPQLSVMCPILWKYRRCLRLEYLFVLKIMAVKCAKFIKRHTSFTIGVLWVSRSYTLCQLLGGIKLINVLYCYEPCHSTNPANFACHFIMACTYMQQNWCSYSIIVLPVTVKILFTCVLVFV